MPRTIASVCRLGGSANKFAQGSFGGDPCGDAFEALRNCANGFAFELLRNCAKEFAFELLRNSGAVVGGRG